MNCCNEDCEQGDLCPAHIKKKPVLDQDAVIDLALFVLTIVVALAAAATLLELAHG